MFYFGWEMSISICKDILFVDLWFWGHIIGSIFSVPIFSYWFVLVFESGLSVLVVIWLKERGDKWLNKVKKPATEISKTNECNPKDFKKICVKRIFSIYFKPYGC